MQDACTQTESVIASGPSQQLPDIAVYVRSKRLASQLLESGDVKNACRAMQEANAIKRQMLEQAHARLAKAINDLTAF